jgi:hypothetical protein
MSVGSITPDTQLPYAASSFNKVLSVDAAYHFKTRERFVAVRKTHSLLFSAKFSYEIRSICRQDRLRTNARKQLERARRCFLQEASRTLVIGGGLIVADMILSQPFRDLSCRQRLCLRMIAAAVGIPMANLVDENEYVEMLQRNGFGAWHAHVYKCTHA